jgi:hypothetical protein
MVLSLYCLVMLLSLLSLYGYHLNLIRINQTTNERMKGVYASDNNGMGGTKGHGGSNNPHDRGCLRNYLRLCCEERLPPSELPVMHEKVSAYEYARLRDSFTGFPGTMMSSPLSSPRSSDFQQQQQQQQQQFRQSSPSGSDNTQFFHHQTQQQGTAVEDAAAISPIIDTVTGHKTSPAGVI